MTCVSDKSGMASNGKFLMIWTDANTATKARTITKNLLRALASMSLVMKFSRMESMDMGRLTFVRAILRIQLRFQTAFGIQKKISVYHHLVILGNTFIDGPIAVALKSNFDCDRFKNAGVFRHENNF